MGVGGHYPNGGGPLMVLLVEAFIEVWMVEQPEERGGGGDVYAGVMALKARCDVV